MEGIGERVTGAIFEGSGQALVMPPTTVERKQLSKFTGSPILSASFTKAYFRFTDNTFRELLDSIRRGGGRPRHEPDLIKEWTPFLRKLNLGHTPRLLMDLLEPDAEGYFYVRLFSPDLGWFDMIVDDRRDESVLIGQVVSEHGDDDRVRYNIWSSFSPEGRAAPPLPARPRRYRIRTTIQPDASLTGQSRIELEVTQSGPRLLLFQLSRFLDVTAVRQNGESIEFFQNAGLEGDEVLHEGNDQVLVVLTRPAPLGESINLEFEYEGRVISDLGDGVLYVGARGLWYPSLFATDPVHFEMTFRYPRKWTLVAAGEKTGGAIDGDWAVGTWTAEVPVMLAGFNVGEYETATVDTNDYRIEVFANRAFEQRLASRKGRTNRTAAESSNGEPGESNGAATPAPADLLDQVATDVADSLEFFSEIFEPYPRKQLYVSQIPALFGQGYPGLIYLSTYSFLSPAMQQQLGLSDETRRFYRELMPAHETAHQWWGTSIPSAGYRDNWLSEALATYSGLLYYEHRRGATSVQRAWLGQFRDELLEKLANGETLESTGPLVIGPRLNTAAVPNGSNRIIYTKGPWVVHMLREVLRDPETGSDHIFLGALKKLTQRPVGKPLDLAQFRQAFEKQLPEWADLDHDGTLEWFFTQWVEDTGIPEYDLTWEIKMDGNEMIVTGSISQQDVDDLFIMPVPIYARYGTRLERIARVVVAGQEVAFSVPIDQRPDEIVLDPFDTVLRQP